jgi:hypothetical protein
MLSLLFFKNATAIKDEFAENDFIGFKSYVLGVRNKKLTIKTDA